MIIDEDKYIEKLEQDLKLAGWTNSIEANTYYSIMRLSGADCILYINDKPVAIIEIKVSRNQKIIFETGQNIPPKNQQFFITFHIYLL